MFALAYLSLSIGNHSKKLMAVYKKTDNSLYENNLSLFYIYHNSQLYRARLLH
jgi:hypothetical protein